MSDKAPEAFRTISEVADELDLPQHVLRFWETRFSQIRPMKRGGGRRYYRPEDVDLLRGIRHILYGEGYTIKGAQRILKERGVRHVAAIGRGEDPDAVQEMRSAAPTLKAAPVDPLSEYAPKRVREQAHREEPKLPQPPAPAEEPEEEEDDLALRDAPETGEQGDGYEAEDERDEASLRAVPPAGVSHDTERALRSVLYELQDCRRILRDLRGKSHA